MYNSPRILGEPLSNGVIKSTNTPAPSELPTRNQYKGMLEPASRLSSMPAR